MDFFFPSFTQHVGVTHLVCWFLPEEIIPFVAVDFSVSKGRGEFRMLLNCHFELTQQLKFNLMNIHSGHLLSSRHCRKFFEAGEAPMPMDQNRIQTTVCMCSINNVGSQG